jgi:hypothetical protein
VGIGEFYIFAFNNGVTTKTVKNRFYIEQLEPRILLSGDILSQLVPLLSSHEAVRMQSEYLQEHPEARRVYAPTIPAGMVVVGSDVADITEASLMYPFEDPVAPGAEQPSLFADFSSEYNFSDTEWDALEDGWRNIS